MLTLLYVPIFSKKCQKNDAVKKGDLNAGQISFRGVNDIKL